MGDSVGGDTPTVFQVGDIGVGSTICWENIFADLFRRFVVKGARVVINATNEAWFQDSSAPRQFLAISVFRAAENRVAVLRVANTGISAAIDPYGRIVRRLRGPEGRGDSDRSHTDRPDDREIQPAVGYKRVAHKGDIQKPQHR